METLSDPAGARDGSGWQHRGYLPRASSLQQRERQRCPLAQGGERQRLQGRDSRRGLSPAGSGVAHIPERDGLPGPFPLGIPELTHRARDCETRQEMLLGIRAVCLLRGRIFLPLSRPDGDRAQGTGKGTQQDLRDKPACPVQCPPPAVTPPSREGLAQRRRTLKVHKIPQH